jgi:hypothetical protein
MPSQAGGPREPGHAAAFNTAELAQMGMDADLGGAARARR